MKNSNLKEITADKNLVAFCGLYCGACRSFLSGKCPGCKDNVKATWCDIRKCCLENNLLSCSDCNKIEVKECKKYNNFVSKIIGFVTHSDRSACIVRIKEIGYNNFSIEMAANKVQTIKKK